MLERGVHYAHIQHFPSGNSLNSIHTPNREIRNDEIKICGWWRYESQRLQCIINSKLSRQEIARHSRKKYDTRVKKENKNKKNGDNNFNLPRSTTSYTQRIYNLI